MVDKKELKNELIEIENELAALFSTSESEFHKILESIESPSIPGIQVRIKTRGTLIDKYVSHGY